MMSRNRESDVINRIDRPGIESLEAIRSGVFGDSGREKGN